MIIDKVGGVGPNYGPKKNEPTARAETPLRAGDAVTISAEGARAAGRSEAESLYTSEHGATFLARRRSSMTFPVDCRAFIHAVASRCHVLPTDLSEDPKNIG